MILFVIQWPENILILYILYLGFNSKVNTQIDEFYLLNKNLNLVNVI